VLRGVADSAPPSFKRTFEGLCVGNLYTTTIHAINSALVKCSKLTKVSKVRGGAIWQWSDLAICPPPLAMGNIVV